MTNAQYFNDICDIITIMLHNMYLDQILFKTGGAYKIYLSNNSIDIVFNNKEFNDPYIDKDLILHYFKQYLNKKVYSIYEAEYIPLINYYFTKK